MSDTCKHCNGPVWTLSIDKMGWAHRHKPGDEVCLRRQLAAARAEAESLKEGVHLAARYCVIRHKPSWQDGDTEQDAIAALGNWLDDNGYITTTTDSEGDVTVAFAQPTPAPEPAVNLGGQHALADQLPNSGKRVARQAEELVRIRRRGAWGKAVPDARARGPFC